MVDEKILAKTFRAAAIGVMAPYNPTLPIGQSSMLFTYDGKSYDLAKSIAGAFNAVALVFETLSEAVDESEK